MNGLSGIYLTICIEADTIFQQTIWKKNRNDITWRECQ